MNANFQSEFPDYDASRLPAIPAHWVDQSWRNDSCPSWSVGPFMVYVDYADPAMREHFEGPRFSVLNNPDAPNGDPDHNESVLDSDDWDEVLACVAAGEAVC